jgi:hypothetical protein
MPEITRPDGTVDTSCVVHLMRQGRPTFPKHKPNIVDPAIPDFYRHSVKD